MYGDRNHHGWSNSGHSFGYQPRRSSWRQFFFIAILLIGAFIVVFGTLTLGM